MLPADRRVVIVVPCYNEADRLPVEQFRDYLAHAPTHFVFVNDGSRDATVGRIAEIRLGYESRVTLLDLPANCGKAEAVRRGIGAALATRPTFVGFWDADLATPLDTIDRFLAVFADKAAIDMVIGSRVKLLGRRIDWRAARHYLGRVFATAVSMLLKLPVYDTQCGAKIFRVDARVKTLWDRPFIGHWVFDVELLARYIEATGSARTAAGHLYEYPLEEWEDVEGSKVRPAHFLIAIGNLAAIYRRYSLPA